jgi:hypothetical protein
VTEQPKVEHGLELPSEPIEIVAGSVQLRPWEQRLAAELAELHGRAEPDGVARRLREWHEGVALSFAVQEITTARLLGEVVLRPLPDRAATVTCWTGPEIEHTAVAATAVDAVRRWALGALGAQRVVHVRLADDPHPPDPRDAQ